MDKAEKTANILKGVGYLLPLALVVLLMIFWGKTWVMVLTVGAVIAGVFVYWKFAIPFVLMMCYAVISVVVCVVESALKGLYLITGLGWVNIVDSFLSGFRKMVWEKLKNLTENSVFKALE